MSKRGRGTAGAFDTVVHAITGLGAAASRIALPPATAPGSLARALAHGKPQTTRRAAPHRGSWRRCQGQHGHLRPGG